jgi:hypothetical protein
MESLPKQIKQRELMGGRINYATNPIDCCIICKQKTTYRKNTHINARRFYVEGCGQLCGSCYMACHNTSTADTFQDYLFE